MRFTPSANWTSIASGSNRVVTWTVSIKKTSALNEALSAGTWVDVTSFINDMPSISQQIEYELGQFSSDSISFTARNIDWWEANVFNATDYIELKVTATLGRGSTVTSDTLYAFCGFVDKVGVSYDEIADSVSFDVYTADELGNRISVLNINTQYFNSDIDGAGTDGLLLPRMKGIFVKNANIDASNPLRVGLHQLEYVNATQQIKLDDGDYTTLSGSDESITLANGAGDQKLQIYVDASEIEYTSAPIVDYVIVETQGTTLPQQPHYGLSVGQHLKLLYSEIGVSTSSLSQNNLFKTATFDSTRRLSYYDSPPNDYSITGEKRAVAFDGTDIWVGVGNKLYRRVATTEAYELHATLTSGRVILKIIYNARNNHFWLACSSGSSRTKADKIIVYDYNLLGLTNEISLTSSAGLYTIDLMDYNYTGSLYHYALLLCDTSTYTNAFKEIEISGSTLTISTVDTNTASPAVVPLTGFGVITDSGQYYTWEDVSSAGASLLRRASYDSLGLWIVALPTTYLSSSGSLFSSDITAGGVFVSGSNRIYYWDKGGGFSYLTLGAANLYAATGITGVNSPGTNSAVSSDGTIILYSTVHASTAWTLYSYNQTTVTSIDDVKSNYSAISYDTSSSTFYGIDDDIIFQYGTTINFFTKGVFGDVSVKSALSSLLQAFNLVGTISSHKKAFVYRRGNDSGTIQTTGNNLSLTTANTSQITKVLNEYQKILWVEVTSGDTTYSYDGTTYNAGILSDARQMTISNDLIPEGIVQDLAKYFFTFYNTAHDKYSFNVDTANMEYEVMDGASVVFSTTKIAQTATGLITSQSINNDGSLQIEVIF